jgi:hypothetical protein
LYENVSLLNAHSDGVKTFLTLIPLLQSMLQMGNKFGEQKSWEKAGTYKIASWIKR